VSLVLGIAGLPIPDEFLLFLSGYLVFKNVLSFGPTVSVATLGTICGIMVSYWLGRMSGSCLSRFERAENGLQTTRRFLEKFGRWTLVFGYLIPGIRNLTGFTAGASRLHLRRFAPYAAMGAAISSCTCITIGYFFGMNAEWVFSSAQRVVLLGIAPVAAFMFLRRYRRASS